MFFSVPQYGIGLVAWVFLIPLLFALRDCNVSGGALLGFVTGLAGYAGVFYWITYVVVKYGQLPLVVGLIVMLLLVAYLSIYLSLFAAGIVHCRTNGIPEVISAPLLWVCLEYGKSHLLTGFPWENIAYTQYLNTILIQSADIAGIYGLAFIIVMFNVVIYDVITKGAKGAQVEASIMCMILIFLYGYGVLRVNQIRDVLKDSSWLKVTIVQGNIDQAIKWNPQYQRETIQTYKTLSLNKANAGFGLIVWPETAVPFFFQEQNELRREIENVAVISGKWLLLGSPSYKVTQGELSLLNSAFLLSPDGKTQAQYDKVHLVPYGEYVPLKKFFPFIKKMVVGVGDFIPGKDYYPLSMNDVYTIGVLICYEGIFPEASRVYKTRGADVLINITNDAWFGKTSAPYQHLSMTVFRAVENRVYLVRAANSGISALINPVGEIISQTELFTKAVLYGEVKKIKCKTFYAHCGDVFVYGCMVVLILYYIYSMRRRNVYGRGAI